MKSTFHRTTVFFLAALLAIFAPHDTLSEAVVSQPTKTEPILVEAFLPLGSGCMDPMVEYLNALEKKYAGRIKVVITDFSQPEG